MTTGTSGLDLEQWRKKEGLSYEGLAFRIGALSGRQARAWALGLERPSATVIERITAATNWEVTVHAMHTRRLAWEQRNAVPIKELSERSITSLCRGRSPQSTARRASR
jgi:hypothetical protein